MPQRKGQSALEAAFVVLFIAVAIIAIFAKATVISAHIGDMAGARAIAQETANQLSLKGTVTHLVRVDPNEGGGSSLLPVKLHVISEDCDIAEDGFKTALNDPSITVNCEEPGLYYQLEYD